MIVQNRLPSHLSFPFEPERGFDCDVSRARLVATDIALYHHKNIVCVKCLRYGPWYEIPELIKTLLKLSKRPCGLEQRGEIIIDWQTITRNSCKLQLYNIARSSEDIAQTRYLEVYSPWHTLHMNYHITYMDDILHGSPWVRWRLVIFGVIGHPSITPSSQNSTVSSLLTYRKISKDAICGKIFSKQT